MGFLSSSRLLSGRRRVLAARSRRRPVDRRGVGLVLPEGPVDRRLAAAVGQNHGEVRDSQRSDDGDGGQPAEVVDKHQDRCDEADRPDAHHEQIPALAVSDVRGEARTRLSDQVGLVAPSSSCLHVSHVIPMSSRPPDRLRPGASSQVSAVRALLVLDGPTGSRAPSGRSSRSEVPCRS
jgi:hypothetical protein